MDLPTLSQLKALRVVDLKQRLSELSLPQSGLKADLVARLDAHYNNIRNQGAQEQIDSPQSLQQDPYQQQQQAYGQQAQQGEVYFEQQNEQQLYLQQHHEQQLLLQQQQQEAEMMLQQQLEEQRIQEEQARQQELLRQQQEEERLREQQAKQREEFLKQQQEEERRQEEMLRQKEAAERQAREQELLRQQQEQEALKKQQEEEEERKRQEEEERKRQEEEERKRQEEEERKRQEEEEERKRQELVKLEEIRRAEEEKLLQKKKLEEEALRRQQEEEKLRLQKEAEEKLRQQQAMLLEYKELQRQQEEAERKAEEEMVKRLEEEKQEQMRQEQLRLEQEERDRKKKEEEERMESKNKRQTFSFSNAPPALANPNPVPNFDDQELESATPNKPSQPMETFENKENFEHESFSGDDKAKGNKKKKKKKKKNRPEQWAKEAAEAERRKLEQEEQKTNNEPLIEVEYVEEKLDMDPSDPMFRTFSKIFDAFKITTVDEDVGTKLDEKQEKPTEELKKVPKLLEADDLIEEAEDDNDDKPKMSKRKLKKLNRLSVAELKQLVSRPDVVEMHDVTARDPRLLVHLKSTRNTVPVPRHWCFKRKYLQGKRGIEKPPFDLPDFIKKTGIMEMRAALQEKEESKGLKSKMREKVRPKLGKIDIDYQKLHDAFFKWQTKPKMTLHGDLYYEGKEFEIRLKEKKPGDLSDDLRTALGMPVGPNAHKVPPPWLIAMQRYGPPPSYPNLKIAGLNAPIPDGCSFGYHAGGWGKPPVDEAGKPLYGDVFGTSDSAFNQQIPQEEIDTSLWGELESESEEEESDEEEEEEEEGQGEGEEAQNVQPGTGIQTPVVDAGLTTPSGLSSVGLGQETPELLELRKKRIEAEMEGGETPNLYTIVPEKKSERIGSSMMGSTHTYDIRKATGIDPSGVELALNPEEVDLMDTDAMQARAEAALREQQASLAKEDLSDMIAEHAAKQSSKRKRAAVGKDDRNKGAKKYKEFKF